MSPTKAIRGLKEEALNYHQRYKSYIPAIFFVSGFVFDLLTIGQIDHWSTLLQQGIFVTLITIILFLMLKSESGQLTIKPRLKRIWSYHIEALHFLLGGLLNAYLLFYFKSGSLASSFVFLGFIAIILILNETRFLKSVGLKFKFVLLSLCTLSFFMTVIPTLMGKISWLSFILSIVAFVLFHIGLGYLFSKSNIPSKILRNNYYLPIGGFLSVFVALYILNFIPPIPLSVKYIGIYNDIAKSSNGEYHLAYKRPIWKFWQNGTQSLEIKSSDPIYCFLKIYSPANFNDHIYLKWFRKNHKDQWVLQDKIRIPITGGRAEGYRGYAYKNNHQEGEWKVHVVTENDKELSRISFDVKYENAGNSLADLQYDQH